MTIIDTFSKKLGLTLGLTAGTAAAISVVAAIAINGLVVANTWVRHTKRVQIATEEVLTSLLDAETAQRGYLLTSNEAFLQPYEQAKKEIDSELINLIRLTSDNSGQTERIEALAALVNQRLVLIAETVHLVKIGESQSAIEIVRTGKGNDLMERSRAVIAAILSEEASLLEIRQSYADTSTLFAYFSLAALSLFSLLSCVYSYQITRREIERREQAEKTASELAQHNEDLLRESRYGVKIGVAEIQHYVNAGAEKDEILGALDKMLVTSGSDANSTGSR